VADTPQQDQPPKGVNSPDVNRTLKGDRHEIHSDELDTFLGKPEPLSTVVPDNTLLSPDLKLPTSKFVRQKGYDTSTSTTFQHPPRASLKTANPAGAKQPFSPYGTPDEQAEIANMIRDYAGSTGEAGVRNLTAFTKTIAWSEGTMKDGGMVFNTNVNDQPFFSYKDHPHNHVPVPRYKKKSDAAGAPQIMGDTWDEYSKKLGLKDFSPVSQMRVELELIKDVGAMPDVLWGNFRSAVHKTNKKWASFPGNSYGQTTRSVDELENHFVQYGGTPTDTGLLARVEHVISEVLPHAHKAPPAPEPETANRTTPQPQRGYPGRSRSDIGGLKRQHAQLTHKGHTHNSVQTAETTHAYRPHHPTGIAKDVPKVDPKAAINNYSIKQLIQSLGLG